MGRFLRRWPTLIVGVGILAASVGMEESNAPQTMVVFIGAVGAVMVGFSLGKGPTNGNGHE